MIRYYTLIEGKVKPSSTTGSDDITWCDVFQPTDNELMEVSKKFNIAIEDMEDSLDENEHPRHTIDILRNNHFLLLHVVPSQINENANNLTVPIGIFLTKEKKILTVYGQSLRNFQAVFEIMNQGAMPDSYSLLGQILHFLFEQVNQFTQEFAKQVKHLQVKILKSQNVGDIHEPFRLNSLLISYNPIMSDNAMAWKSFNESVLPEIKQNLQLVEKYNDLQIDINQIEKFSSILGDVLANSLDAYASVINNNLSNVMKTVGSISLILMIPSIIASLYGMNVGLPGGGDPEGGVTLAFYLIVGVSFLLSFGVWRIFRHKHWL